MEGVRIVEVAAWTFVPAAGAVFADWGADVIKVEHPVTGDPQRGLVAMSTGAGAPNVFVEQPNRGKRSIAIDIATDAGRDLLYQLVASADVFLTNFLGPVRQRLRIDVDDLLAVNPRLIYVRGTGQGVNGPDADKGGFDMASAWYHAGIGYKLTPPGADAPVGQPAAFVDLMGGMTIAAGIAAALFQRERTGANPVVDVSLFSVGAWIMSPDILTSHYLGQSLPTPDRTSPPNPLVNSYLTQDGRWLVLVMLQADRFWPDLCQHLGHPELIDDDRFRDAAARLANRDECVQVLSEIFAFATARRVAGRPRHAGGCVGADAGPPRDPRRRAGRAQRRVPLRHQRRRHHQGGGQSRPLRRRRRGPAAGRTRRGRAQRPDPARARARLGPDPRAEDRRCRRLTATPHIRTVPTPRRRGRSRSAEAGAPPVQTAVRLRGGRIVARPGATPSHSRRIAGARDHLASVVQLVGSFRSSSRARRATSRQRSASDRRGGWHVAKAAGTDGGAPPKAASVVAATVRNRIIRGELREGDALPAENELIAQFGISRPSIREALRILESESLITLQRGARGGARVHAPSIGTAARYAGAVLQTQETPLEDVYQARRLIEPFAVEVLARRADQADVARLREFLAREEQAIPDPEEFVRLSQQFHVELVAASGQQTLALFAAMLNDIIERHMALLTRRTQPTERPQPRWKALASHDRLIELIEAGDVAEARAFWETHIDAVKTMTLGADGALTVLDLLD